MTLGIIKVYFIKKDGADMIENVKSVLKDGYTIESAYQQFKKRSQKQMDVLLESSLFIKMECPEYKDRIILEAEQFMAGKMVLCGTMGKSYFVGNPPKWMENPLNDNEFVWQLNRMEHWVTLVRAYYLTGEERYAEKVLSELENWIDTCPPLEIVLDYQEAKERFSSVHPWRSLEVGIRSHSSWNTCLEALSGYKGFTEGLFEKVIMSFYQHGSILYQVCPVIWPDANHNHYLTECIGLLAVGAMTPFFKESSRWVEHAVREVERCAGTQVVEGGGQIEGCPTYHNECLNWMNRSLIVASKYGIEFSETYKEQVRSMFRHSMYVARPDGNNVPWGDSDALPQVYESAIRTYIASGDMISLKMCAKAYGRDKLRSEVIRLIWDIPNPEQLLRVLEEEGFGEEAVRIPCRYYSKDLKQVMLRKGWNDKAASVFFACRTPVHNDHAHIDPNGFDYYSQGIPVLVDAGRYNYQEGPNRKLFKGGTYHNTLLIDQKDAFEYQGTWAYGEQQIGDILNIGSNGEWDYVCGSHANYFPVIHTRMLAFRDDMLLIADRVDNRMSENQVSIYYNLNTPKAELHRDSSNIQAEVEGRTVKIAYSPNLSCTLGASRASTQIDVALDTTMVRLDSEDKSRLYLTILWMGSEDAEVKVDSINDTVEFAEIEFHVNEEYFDFKWTYGDNILERLNEKGKGDINE